MILNLEDEPLEVSFESKWNLLLGELESCEQQRLYS